MHFTRRLLLIVAAIIFATTILEIVPAVADTTYVSGAVYTGNTTWSLSGSPYVLQGTIYIRNCRLTIEPGVEILGSTNGAIWVGQAYLCGNYTCQAWAEIYAVGTDAAPITFTSLDGLAGGWHGIYFYDSNDKDGHTSRFEHCVIENAGRGGWGKYSGIHCDRSNQPLISHCELRNIPGAGLYLESSSPMVESTVFAGDSIGIHCLNSWPRVTSCAFENNEDCGVFLEGESFPNLSGNQYTNTGYGIVVGGGEMTDLTGTWHYDNGEPYMVFGNVYLQNAGLNIDPGTVIKFANTGIQFGKPYLCGNRTCYGWAELRAVGTPDSQIVMTSMNGQPDGWNGLYFYPSNDDNGHTSLLEHCVVENAGRSAWTSVEAGIYCNGSNQPRIRNCVFRDIGGVGLYLESSSMFVDSSTFDGDSVGVHCRNSWPSITDCTFENNSAYGLYLKEESFPNLSDNHYLNTGIGIAVGGGEMSDLTGTWHYDNGEPYVVLGNVYMQNARLNIDPGAIIKFSNTGIQFGKPYLCGNYTCYGWAELNAIGTPDHPIVLTSWSGQPDSWNGLYFYRSNDDNGHTSSMEHCVVENAGRNAWANIEAGIYCDGSGQPHIRNCAFQNIGGAGLYLSSSSPTIDSSTFADDSTGIHCTDSWPSVTSSKFENNARYGIYLQGESFPNLSGNQYANNGYGIAVVGGEMTDLTGTWHYDSGEPYVVLGNVYMRNARLNIDPGAVIKFANTGLQLGRAYLCGNYTCQGWGEIHAVGTENSPITLTSLSGSSEGWNGLYFYYSNDDDGHTSALEHCIVEKAGRSAWAGIRSGVYCDRSNQPRVRNCEVRDNFGAGVYLNSSSPIIDSSIFANNNTGIHCTNSWPLVAHNSFENNSGYGLYLQAESFPNLSGNYYANNGIGIAFQGGAMTNLTGTFHYDGGEPYVILSDTRIENTSLTIEPGVTVKFRSDAGLQLGNYYCPNGCSHFWGELHAIGTVAQPIIFTSESGETNGWDGIYFHKDNHYNGHSSRLEYCVVEKAGQADWSVGANLYCDGTSQPWLKHCAFQQSAVHGVIVNNSWLVLDSCAIIDNLNCGVLSTGYSQPTIGGTPERSCDIYGNGNYNVYNSTANPIDARYNYWEMNDSAGIAATVYDKDDNSSFGTVQFMPFRILEHDAAISRIVEPPTSVYYGTVVIPQVWVQNRGSSTDTVPVIFEIGTDGAYYRDSVDVPLLPGDSLLAVFSPFVADSINVFDISCYHRLLGDEQGGNDTIHVQLAVITDPNVPVILSMTPISGGNTGSVAATLLCANVKATSQLMLVRGSDTVTIDELQTLVLPPDTIFARIDLTGLSVGEWQVVVQNPNGLAGSYQHPFLIEHGIRDLNVELIGPQTARGVRSTTYLLRYENRGNVDAFSPFVVVAGPPSVHLQTSIPRLIQHADPNEVLSEAGGLVILAFEVSHLASGEIGTVPITITPAEPPPHDSYEVELYTMITEDVYPFLQRELTLIANIELPSSLTTINADMSEEEYPREYKMDPNHLNPPAGYIMVWQTCNSTHVATVVGTDSQTGKRMILHLANPQRGLVLEPLEERHLQNLRGAFRPVVPDKNYAKHGVGVAQVGAYIYNLYKDKTTHTTYDLCASWIGDELIGNCMSFLHLMNPEFAEHGLYTLDQIYLAISGRELAREPAANCTAAQQASIQGVLKTNQPTDCLNCKELCNAISSLGKSFRTMVVRSFDPNTKYGPPGIGALHFVDGSEPFPYMVQFENDSSAGLYSDTIWVVDTLSEFLDWTTLEFGEIYPGDGPDSIRPNFDYDIDFDQNTGVITWSLYDINLPPDTFPYWGEGWVSYSVIPKPNLPTGTRIENIAAIKFDVNDWILAPMDSIPIFNTIDAGAPSSSMFGLVSELQLNSIPLCWSAKDDSLGSGVESVDIYVSENGDPYQLWTSVSAISCTTFVGSWGSSYDFYTIAHDSVGHAEEAPTNPDASTSIVNRSVVKFWDAQIVPNPISIKDASVNLGKVVPGDSPPVIQKELPEEWISFIIRLAQSTQATINLGDSAIVFVDANGDGSFSADEQYPAIVGGAASDDPIGKVDVYVEMGADLIDNSPRVAIYTIGGYAIANLDGVYIDYLRANTWTAGSQGKQGLAADGLPRSYDLEQNYPNPFNASTIIRFALPEPAKVSLEVFNVLGQRVASIVSGDLPAGYHSITWEAKDQSGHSLSSGVYFYRLSTQQYSKTRKLLLMK